MFEAIALNRRRSLWLISLMGVVLALLGALIGLAVAMFLDPSVAAHTWVTAEAGGRAVDALHWESPGSSFWEQVARAQSGIWLGIAGALAVWLVLWLTAVSAGESILLRTARAREISKADAPQLWNIVEEMTIASGLPRIPRVFIIDDASLNAFAVGQRPDKAAVAVTAGLLKRLNRDELQGVIAHELGHVRNEDVKFMTLAGVMVGAIVLVAHGFLRGLYYSGGRRRSGGRGGGGAAAIVLIIAILVAILAPLAAQLLYFACSRRREFLADASAALFTRYPVGLVAALEKIAQRPGEAAQVSKVLAPMFIVNPLEARSAFSLFATHPPLRERILILRGMAGAGPAAYEAAFQRVKGSGQRCIGDATLKDAPDPALRAATAEPDTPATAVARAQQVGALLDHVLPLVVIPCVCGVRMKLPPDFRLPALKCPRCGRSHPVPRATPAAGPRPKADALRYERKGAGWESFQCACGHPIQLSPSFAARYCDCPKCRRRIEIVTAPAA